MRTFPSSNNITSRIETTGRIRPDAIALHVLQTKEAVSFGMLWDRTTRFAASLRNLGLGANDRVLIMLYPGIDMVAATYAVMQIGAVAVFVDPGMGQTQMLRCIETVAPKAMISIRLLHLLRLLQPRAFRSVSVSICHGYFPGTVNLQSFLSQEGTNHITLRELTDCALIAFTSGSTGEPKGVTFPHGALEAQVRVFAQEFHIGPRDVCLAVFPTLAVLGPALGCTTVVPEFDRRGPAGFDPKTLVEAIHQYGVTHSFGSPVIWDRVGKYLEDTSAKLPTMRCLLMGGAPVSLKILDRFRGRLAAGAEACAPYGSTEAVPITNVNAKELRDAYAHPSHNVLVGRPVEGIEIRILEISDGPLRIARPLQPLDVGEVTVRGAMVSPSYFARDEVNAVIKIPDAGGTWHRTGDLGYFDLDGRLWLVGRKSERVVTKDETLFTAPVESLLANHVHNVHIALIGLGEKPNQQPALVVELSFWKRLSSQPWKQDILSMAQSLFPTIEKVFFRRRLPRDGRHQAKILRGQLAEWAERK